MKAILTLATLLFILTQFNAQEKTFNKFYSVYKQKKPSKLIKKANKHLEKNNKDPIPYYFLSLAYYQLYSQSHITSSYSKAIRNLKKAKACDKSLSTWEYLSIEFSPIDELIIKKVKDLSVRNKKKALKLCEDYLFIFEDSLSQHENLVRLTQPTTIALNQELTNNPKSFSKNKRDSIQLIAASCLGTPYKWAGESKKGFDCSGFVKYVLGNVGIKLPHNANKISYLGQEISEEKAQTGDIILFGSRNENGHHAYHVGIIYENINGNIKVIHSISKGVNISSDYTSYWKERKLMIINVLDYPLNNEVSQNRTNSN